MPKHLTIGQLAEMTGQPEWKIRRAVDSLDEEIPRAGLYRLIPEELVPQLMERLEASERNEGDSEG